MPIIYPCWDLNPLAHLLLSDQRADDFAPQIWFQNRRQITRRRSRPFSSQDSGVSDMFSSQESNVTTVFSSFSAPDVGDEYLSSPSTLQQSQTVLNSTSSAQADQKGNNETDAKSSAAECATVEIPAADIVPPTEKEADTSIDSTKLESSSTNRTEPLQSDCGLDLADCNTVSFPSINSSTSQKSRPAFASLRSSSFIIHQDRAKSHSASSVRPDGDKVKPRNAISLPSTLRRSSSLLKLSTSFDGKAKVTTGSESPSPPKLRATRPITGLQRSQSAVEPSRQSDGDILFSSFRSPKRLMTGRSRDARTWEFYCDNDARDALTEQAEREQSGSAAGVISLIRSQSNKALASNPNKRNTNTAKIEPSKRLKADEAKTQKRKLSRTISSVARLQTASSGKQSIIPGPKKPKSSSQSELLVDPGDSDKENWEPGTQTRIHRRRRPVNSANQARRMQSVLKESLHIPSQSTSLDAFLDCESGITRSDDQENDAQRRNGEEITDLAADGDVAREPDDLDCVQNLLSLRQGAWR